MYSTFWGGEVVEGVEWNKLRNRNNTSFPKELNELLKSLEQVKNDPLQYHQRLAHDYILHYNHIRGILAYQGMGSGKSILAAALGESMAAKYSDIKVIFIASKSLHNNFKENIKKYLQLQAEKESKGALSEEQLIAHIESLYDFVSLNAGNMLKQVRKVQTEEDVDVSELYEDKSEWYEEQASKELEKISHLGNLDKCFVIIDEAHNFFNSIVNGSKNAIGLYRLIMASKWIKLLFLTGSPIINDPYELAICYNMLAGYLGKPEDGITLFGEDYNDFIRYFIGNPETLDLDKTDRGVLPVVKNRDKFADRIVGLTSYYAPEHGAIKHLFPELRKPIVLKVPMSARQYALYGSARDREIEEAKRGVFKSKKQPLIKARGATSSYRVRSRQISNFRYPSYASKTYQDSHGFLRYEKYPEQLKPESFRIVAKPGVGEEEMGLETWSPKILEILKVASIYTAMGILDNYYEIPFDSSWEEIMIERGIKKAKTAAKKDSVNIGPILIYSQFLDSGLIPIALALKYNGCREVKTMDDLLSGAKSVEKNKETKFCIISGEVDPDTRMELIKAFSSPANKRGEVIAFLLFTSTGAEGINTKYCKCVMAMEPFWHWARLEQVFHRAARLNSHVELPETERFVQPYIFLSDYPLVVNKDDKDDLQKMRKLETTTDITLYEKAIHHLHLNESFLQILRDASFDCAIFGSGKCRICKPTDIPLFIENLDKDIRSPSNCQATVEEKVKAKSIHLREKEYMYSVDSTKGNIRIYEYNPILKGYEEIYVEHPDYLEIYNLISSNKGKK